MDELLPIGTGIILGIAFATRFRVLRPVWVKACLIVLAGIAATLSSGEYRESWGFVLVDIGEVGLMAWIAAFLLGRFAFRGRTAGRPTDLKS
ncbi:MAG TPA: hypothetical protein VJ487_20495 [Alphaproteobacteria bacterium]|nr:hypothetical protein [Alphaproteobacteria bacterium]